MSTIAAHYFDGRRAQRHPVTLVPAGGRIKIVGREITAEFEARRVRVSTRLAHTPRWIYLPGGAACVSDDNDAIDRLVRERRVQRVIHGMEARPAFAAVAVLLVAALFWAIVDVGLPLAAARVAEHVPVEAETVLGREALEGMDQFGLAPSSLPQERQAELAAKLQALAALAPDAPAYRLELRAAPIIGANALALP
jgi:hypothetical protein